MVVTVNPIHEFSVVPVAGGIHPGRRRKRRISFQDGRTDGQTGDDEGFWGILGRTNSRMDSDTWRVVIIVTGTGI